MAERYAVPASESSVYRGEEYKPSYNTGQDVSISKWFRPAEGEIPWTEESGKVLHRRRQ